MELAQDSLIKIPQRGMKVIQKDSLLWAEFGNNFAHCRLTTVSLLKQLKTQLKIANELIWVLNNEYHLK